MKLRNIMITGMLVLGMTTPVYAGYTDNGNETVRDNNTHLVWQKQDDGVTRTWEAALNYCEALNLGGKTDWRLPHYRELESIVDTSTYSPAINTTYFPNTESSYYWSSTADANLTSYAWYVYFYNGYVDSSNKTNTYYVRCVRGGQ
ncbi:DUF1566 domain-containing protein [Deltaproteobacteria bacterium TL4]